MYYGGLVWMHRPHSLHCIKYVMYGYIRIWAGKCRPINYIKLFKEKSTLPVYALCRCFDCVCPHKWSNHLTRMMSVANKGDEVTSLNDDCKKSHLPLIGDNSSLPVALPTRSNAVANYTNCFSIHVTSWPADPGQTSLRGGEEGGGGVDEQQMCERSKTLQMLTVARFVEKQQQMSKN